MSLPIEIALPGQAQADVLALPVTDPVELGGDAARIVEQKLDGRLARLAETGELKGEAGKALLLHLGGELQAPRLVVAGLGRRDAPGADSVRTPGAAPRPAAEQGHVSAEGLGPDGIGWLGRGALEGVGRGRVNEPRLIVLRHEPPQPTRPDVVLGLVGKAITFDSGGLSIKPANSMQDMK